MLHYVKLFTTLLKINVQQELAYRTDALVNLLVMLMWTGWELLSLSIIFSNAQTLGGWTLGQLIALLGVFRLISTLMFAIVWPNTEKFNQGMRDGSLDYTLLQPAPSLFLVTFTRIVIWRLADLLLAIGLVVVGLRMSGDSVTLPSLLSFALLLAGGMAIFYSLWIVMMAFTFWFVKFDNNVTILRAARGGPLPSHGVPAVAAADCDVRCARRRDHDRAGAGAARGCRLAGCRFPCRGGGHPGARLADVKRRGQAIQRGEQLDASAPFALQARGLGW